MNFPATQRTILVVGDRAVLTEAATEEFRRVAAVFGCQVVTTDDLQAAMLAIRRDRPAAVLIVGANVPLHDVRALVGLCRLGRATPVALVGPGLAWVARRESMPWFDLPLVPAEICTLVAATTSSADASATSARGPGR